MKCDQLLQEDTVTTCAVSKCKWFVEGKRVGARTTTVESGVADDAYHEFEDWNPKGTPGSTVEWLWLEFTAVASN